ncbi:MAG: hypothetical protein MJ198_05090 [Bacteroidales bacterium]|nr:hypothetical protein [Bacteroidales bacterium]
MKQKIAIVSIVFIVIAVFVAVILWKNSDDNGTFPLKQGSQGEEVRKLQAALNKKNTSGITISEDGIFGPKTESLLVAVTGKTSLTKREYKKLI